MSEYNLIEEPWIPCIDLDGRLIEHGIRETLLKAHELREICDESPLVTTALHRLLLAILYRTYSGPRNFNAWKSLFANKTFNSEKVTTYLNNWDNRFDLRSESHPFYQMARLEMREPTSITRLATECASGNNATLFDHSTDEEGTVRLSSSQAARWLVACQSFALGFGRSGNAKIGGQEETLPYSSDAIALRGVNVWLQGQSVFHTLMINLTPTDDISTPPWELDESHQYRDRLKGKTRTTVGSLGLVDRLTWQSRLVRLLPIGGTFSVMHFTQGRSADKSPGDPMKVYRISKDEGIFPLSLSSSKATWRDAHSILMIPVEKSNERRPECFNLAARLRSMFGPSAENEFVAHLVGLASAPNKAGKFLLWRHDRMPVPTALMANTDVIERLGSLLRNAEDGAFELNNRTRRIAKLYLAPEAESANGRLPDKDEVSKVAASIDPRPAYWARLEQHFFTLLENLVNDWDSTNDDWKSDENQTATRTWCDHLKREAQRSLEESIRSFGTTARAIQAVGRVRTDFNDLDLAPVQEKLARTKRKAKGVKKK